MILRSRGTPRRSALVFVLDDGDFFFLGRGFGSTGRYVRVLVDAGFDVVLTSWPWVAVTPLGIVVRKGIRKTLGEERLIQAPYFDLPVLILNETPSAPLPRASRHQQAALDIVGWTHHSALDQREITARYSDVLQRRGWGQARRCFSPIVEGLGKANLETCFQIAEQLPEPIRVPRPDTLVCLDKRRLAADLEARVRAHPRQRFVVKKHEGTRCEGVFLVCEHNVKSQLAAIAEGTDTPYVVQDYVENAALFHGRRADLRVYVGVASWAPLCFEVYRYGTARVANAAYTAERFEDRANTLTTYQSHVPIAQYLEDACPEERDSFWAQTQSLVQSALRAIVATTPMGGDAALAQCPYLLGFDVMLARSDVGAIEPLLLEINHSPVRFHAIYTEAHNDALAGVYECFFRELARRADVGEPPWAP